LKTEDFGKGSSDRELPPVPRIRSIPLCNRAQIFFARPKATPSPKGEGWGEGERSLRTQAHVRTRVAFSTSSHSAYSACSAVRLFTSFVAFAGFCKTFWLRLCGFAPLR